MAVVEQEINKLNLQLGAKFLQAYFECSDKVQTVVRDMLEILNDKDTDPDDQDMALFTLADALYPNPHNGQLGMDLAESERMGAEYCPEIRHAIQELDQEEETFANKIITEMDRQGLTQEALALKVGIGQPAIANMLNRECRPQRRTVKRFAEAFGIQPDELWPTWNDRN